METNEKMPVVFVGHGSPMNAIEDNAFGQSWKEIGLSIPLPRVIVVVSAHWQTEGIKVTGSFKPEQIYDFYGFPKELYKVKYPAKGSPKTAERIIEILQSTGVRVETNDEWGIDHGAWSVLSRMFPEANVPVIQMSLDIGMSPNEHWEVARKLKKLREEKVLILGSGNVVHNLTMAKMTENGDEWAVEFDKNIKEAIDKEDFDRLKNYEVMKNWEMAIPTNEHYLPMLYTLAMKDKNEKIEFRTEKVTMGSVSMRSWIIGGIIG